MAADPELRHLRALVAVVDAGGFTRAARALGVSQSTVSENIAALERTLGTPVLRKGRRAIELTPAGTALLPHARRLLGGLDAALRDVATSVAEAEVTVSVGTNESISAYVLPSVLATLRATRPATRYQVTPAVCTEVRAGIGTGRFDVGLVLEPPTVGGDEEIINLDESSLVVFAQPSHPLLDVDARARVGVAALSELELHLSDSAGSFHGVLRRYFQAEGCNATRIVSTGSIEGVKRAVLADHRALGVLPMCAVAEDLASGRFTEIRLEKPFAGIVLRALLPRHRHGFGAMELVESLLRGQRDHRIDAAGPPRGR